MKTLLAVSLATLYGVSLRMAFGTLNSIMGIMSLSFLILAPFLIGYLTVILIPKEKIRSPIAAFFLPWLASLGILIITMAFNIEGSICWIMIYPLFSIVAGFGGLVAFNLRRAAAKRANSDDGNRPSTLNLSLVLLIPAFAAIAEGDRTLSPEESNISRTVLIDASSEGVWHALVGDHEHMLADNGFSLSRLMGFPRHLRTTLDTLRVGGKRKAIYENGLYFDETINRYEPERSLVLDIHTDPDHIPPTVMDEHIVIGGKHVDILQDVYRLEVLSPTTCRLTLSSRFTINTPFNWYARIWAKYLMADILNGELERIRDKAIAR